MMSDWKVYVVVASEAKDHILTFHPESKQGIISPTDGSASRWAASLLKVHIWRSLGDGTVFLMDDKECASGRASREGGPLE